MKLRQSKMTIANPLSIIDSGWSNRWELRLMKVGSSAPRSPDQQRGRGVAAEQSQQAGADRLPANVGAIGW
jgi:hypothetical protein